MSLKKIGLIAAGAVTVGGLALAGSTIASAATPSPAPSGSAGAGGNHTAATADETAKVTAALTAKDPAVSVTSVRKDADGSYDVFATKAGSQVMFDVSADLKTISQDAGQARHGGHPGPSASSTTN